jgi:DNA polymerase I
MPVRPCLYTIDVNSHFARCYTIATKHGEPTHAGAFIDDEPVFVLSRVKDLIEREMAAVTALGLPNSHIVIVFDAPGETFRHRIASDYKGQRPPKPASWTSQLDLLYNMMQELGYPCLRVPDVEADDVIATLAHHLPNHGVDVVIFSGDKDLMALVQAGRVWQYVGRAKQLHDQASVEEKMGVSRDRILDRLAMDGDTADNIAGWPNVGPAAATTLLASWSLDELVADPDRILTSGVRGAKGIAQWVGENKAKVVQAKALATLKTDVSLGMNLNQMRRQVTQLSPFFRDVLYAQRPL